MHLTSLSTCLYALAYRQMSSRRLAAGAALDLSAASIQTPKRARSIHAECAQNARREKTARNQTAWRFGHGEEPEDIDKAAPVLYRAERISGRQASQKQMDATPGMPPAPIPDAPASSMFLAYILRILCAFLA